MYLAHITKRNEEVIEQTVAEHVQNTARITAAALESIGLYHTGYVTGILHDAGKNKAEYQEYLHRAFNNEKVTRGEINHTFAGVIWLWQHYHGEQNQTEEKVMCEIIGYAIGSHHGMFDIISEDGKNGFEHRLDSLSVNTELGINDIHYEESIKNFFEECISVDQLRKEIDQAVEELWSFIQWIKGKEFPKSEGQASSEKKFAIGMLCRLILSALIDGDRQETDHFMNGTEYPESTSDMKPVWEAQLTYFEKKLQGFPKDKMGRARSFISDQCKEFASRKGGIYRLSVPTGSGKTLATLRYALAHAAEEQKDRIFFFIPLLSVIDQNAKVLREYIEDESLILEHHSNVVLHTDQAEKMNQYEVLAANWKQPIVISTLVQLLNTLLLGKTTSIRRFQALQNSIIIIDEVQTIPGNVISLFNCAMNFLAYCCHTTVILCSATQPELGAVAHSVQYSTPRDMVSYDLELWKAFQRTRFIDKCTSSGYSQEEIRDFAIEQMEKCESLLLICNTRKEAFDFFIGIRQRDHSLEKPFTVFHLSTAMCMQNRLDIMERIKEFLKQKKRVVVVATQLMEAGVDLSFQCVIRICAGLDNVAQAAGRCNRSGEWDGLCTVYIMNLAMEKLTRLRDIRMAQESLREFLEQFKVYPELFKNDMLSDEAISFYYNSLYKNRQVNNQFDYPVECYHSSLYSMLSDNQNFIQNAREQMDLLLLTQAFKTAGREFQVFMDESQDVIVPYDNKARKIIADLYSERAKHDISYLKNKLKEAQPYTISIFSNQLELLVSQGGLHEIENQPFYTILEMYYHPETGFSIEGYFNV